MTRLILALPFLAACAACPPESVICDDYGTCVCEGATGSIPLAERSRDDVTRDVPERPDVDQPEEPGKEPSRDDFDNEKDYREAHDDWKDGRNG